MLSFHSSKQSRSGIIKGPVLAWYGLLLLPILMGPATLMLAGLFNNQGPVTLVGVLALLALRLYHSHRMNHVSRFFNIF